jgi:hypothetical protein
LGYAIPTQYAISKKHHMIQELDADVGVAKEKGEKQLIRKTIGT